MDFPSASTFGLLPSRRTAISVPLEMSERLLPEEGFEIGLEADDDDVAFDEDVAFEIVFEPWDDDLGAYVIGDLDDDEDEEEDEEPDRDEDALC